MADVTRFARTEDADRAQLFLVTALAIAVLLVSLALILNTAIYTENIATRTTNTQLDVATSTQRALVAASGSILDAENREGDDVTEIEAAFNSSLANWSSTAGTLEAANGFTANVSNTGPSTEGVRIYQNDSTRNFTDDDPSTDWHPVQDGLVRGLRFNVSQDSLWTDKDGAFAVELDDSDAGKATVTMYADGANVNVTVENATETRSCSVEPTLGDSLVVDIGSKTVGTQYCPALELVHDEIDGETDVRFRNAHNASGTYELYATDESGLLGGLFDDANFSVVGSGGPVKEPAVYDVTVRYVFHASDTTVEKEIRVAPGEL